MTFKKIYTCRQFPDFEFLLVGTIDSMAMQSYNIYEYNSKRKIFKRGKMIDSYYFWLCDYLTFEEGLEHSFGTWLYNKGRNYVKVKSFERKYKNRVDN